MPVVLGTGKMKPMLRWFAVVTVGEAEKGELKSFCANTGYYVENRTRRVTSVVLIEHGFYSHPFEER